VAKGGGALVRSVLRAEQACLARLVQGRLQAGARCSDRGPGTSAITDDRTRGKVLGAIEKARAAIAKGCAGVDVGAAPPAGLGMPATCESPDPACAIDVTDLGSLLDCLQCSHVSLVHALVAVEYSESMRSGPVAGTRLVDQASGNDAGQCGAQVQPCKSIQRAVNLAVTGDEIRVAQGTYTFDPAQDPCSGAIGTTAVVCVLNKQLAILGGYSSVDWSTADPGAHPTTIDGENARRGVLVQRTSSGAPAAGLTMHGVTITRGRVHGAGGGGDAATFAFGGGMLTDASIVVLRDVTFTDNQAIGGDTGSAHGGAGSGGGLALRTAPAGTVLEHVTFRNNRAQGGSGPARGGFGIGGGLYTYESVVTAQDLVFEGNVAVGGSSQGSGVAGGERADAQGGGAAFQLGSVASVSRVVVTGNQATGGDAGTDAGGAFGGGLYAELATLTVTDSLLSGNVAVGGDGTNGGIGAGGGLMAGNAPVTIERCRVVNNRSTGGSGSANRGTAGGGGLYLSRFGGNGASAIANSVIAANLTEMGASGTPLGGGGGGLFLQGVQAAIEHATIAGNRLGSSMMQGEGLVLLAGSSGANVTVRYTIIAQHTTPAGAAALHVQPGNAVTLARGVFAGNGRDTNADGSVGAPGTFNGLGTMLGTGALGFVAPGAPAYDYHIAVDSPAVDQATGSTATVDLDGAARVGVPDIGADEAGSD